MKLSIVIVNYNVKYFLHQALTAVYKSEVDFEYEVFVVDNASVDGSCEMVASEFPQVRLIESAENLGFSKGNNLAIRKSQAEYVLLLNPDTIIREDTLQQVADFMDTHEDAGALGVKMYDGQGEFLPESKRGFPSPKVAFFKMSGLARLFPKSKIFGTYHLGYLDEDEIHEVDVLSGAFMLLRKSVLDQVGLLDEDYFMYGEDIDLSYRINQAGYKNYYYPKAPIIHYKGESTKKGSLNYVLVFYRAMIIFAQKNIQRKSGKWYIFLLQIAIYIRAGMALLSRIFYTIGQPVLDMLVMAGSYIGLSWLWENWIRKSDELHFLALHYKVNLPIYICTWLLFNYLVGVYGKTARLIHVWTGMLFGTVAISTFYGFFPEEWRSSRSIILLTFLFSGLLMSLYRIVYARISGKWKLLFYNSQDLVIVGSYEESKRIVSLLNDLSVKRNYIGFISPDNRDAGKSTCLGELQNIRDILNQRSVDEIIFSAKDISSLDIISQIASIDKEINYKVAAAGDVIIGSYSKNTSGELLTYDVGFKINKSYHRRLKRLADIVISVLALVFSPVIIWVQKNKPGFFKNIVLVLIGHKTWVAYHEQGSPHKKLPVLNKGVLTPLDNLYTVREDMSPSYLDRQNYLYAKDYNVFTDLRTVFNALHAMGRE